MNENRPEIPGLNLPPFTPRLRRDKMGRLTIYDPLRRDFFVVTPEELVRQNFVFWLTNFLHYPPEIMANETGISVNGAKRRCDTVVFRPGHTPLAVIEYKAPGIAISQQTFDQIVRYNSCLQADYLIVSNGLEHYCCKMDYEIGSYSFLKEVPDYRLIYSTPRKE